MNTRQMQALKTRQKIVEAGKEVFLKQGFQKTTISQIIKRAQTGYGTAYVYFQNKDELFMEVMEQLMQQFYDVANLPYEPETREDAYRLIAHQVELFLNLAMKNRSMMKVMKEAIGCSPLVEEKWKMIRTRFFTSIERDIQYAQSKGLAKKELNPSLAGRTWFYANEMFMWEIVEQNDIDIEAIVTTLTTMYLEGLY